MGGQTFTAKAKGKTAKDAFNDATARARHDYGHAGYTGSIAEKDSFVAIPVPAGVNPIDFAHDLLRNDDPRVSDKWGPAGCVRVKDNEFYFFGWASS